MRASTTFAHFSVPAGTRPKIPTLHQIRAAIATIALLILMPQPAKADVAEAWVHRFSNVLSNSVDLSSKIARDAEGNIFVSGTTDDNTSEKDILTIKYSGVDGTMIWKQRYNGPENRDDVATGLAVDSRGNVVVTGYSWADNTVDYYTAKYAGTNGALLWKKRYNHEGYRGSDDYARAVAIDADGNVVVTGDSDWDYCTVKYAAADGTLLWEARSSAATNNFNQVTALALDRNGNVVVTGGSSKGSPDYEGSYYTAKYAAASGALLWERQGALSSLAKANALALDSNGNVAVTGYAGINDAVGYYTARYAANDGALIWEKFYSGAQTEGDFEDARAAAVAIDSNGNVLVTGASFNNQHNHDYYTAKYAANDGTLLWEKGYNGPAGGSDHGQAIVIDSEDNVVVTGSSTSSEILQSWYLREDYYTAKYSSKDGALLWENRYASHTIYEPEFGGTGTPTVLVASNGDVVVTGPSISNERKADYHTAKYASDDGTLVWESSYSGPVQHEVRPNALAMDKNGNVLVTGISESEFYTAKYAASNGALLWEKRGTGASAQVVVDGNGNVVVAGSEYGRLTGTSFYTVKYNPDGATLWEKRYKGPSSYDEAATAVALDASGNVIVTGFSAGTNNSSASDFYTAKYAAADGALLWEKRYNGPANGTDQPNAVAVDAAGNVVVTGNSATTGHPDGIRDYDSYTAKYASGDGALLWEKRSRPPTTHDNNFPNAMVMDGSGNVFVTGRIEMSDSMSSYYTAKYASADGTLLWEKMYTDPQNAFATPFAAAVDGTGNVVITGNGPTVKYAGTDGTLIWEKHIPNFIGGYGSAVAVNEQNDVVMTGNVVSNQNEYLFYTARYAAADGSLLWEKTYAEPGSFWNFAHWHNLALGPNGRIAITGSSNLGSAIASDLFTIVYREALSAVGIEAILSSVRLTFRGTAGQSYSIQRAPVVTGPWTAIDTQSAPASGLIQYEEVAGTQGASFYRTSQP